MDDENIHRNRSNKKKNLNKPPLVVNHSKGNIAECNVNHSKGNIAIALEECKRRLKAKQTCTPKSLNSEFQEILQFAGFEFTYIRNDKTGKIVDKLSRDKNDEKQTLESRKINLRSQLDRYCKSSSSLIASASSRSTSSSITYISTLTEGSVVSFAGSNHSYGKLNPMGKSVFEAVCLEKRDTVAIKVINGQHAEKEAHLLSRFKENRLVVQILDYDMDKSTNTMSIVMERGNGNLRGAVSVSL